MIEFATYHTHAHINGLLTGYYGQHFHAKRSCHLKLKRIVVADESKALTSLHLIVDERVRQQMHNLAIGLVVIDPQERRGLVIT
jgi:hypothetical protein